MLYIVPSRGRPDNIRALIEAWEATRDEARLWVCVDDDDPTGPGYEALTLPPWVTLSSGERLRLGGTLNAWADVAVHHDNFSVIGFMGDDHRPRTPHWDSLILETISAVGGTAVVYGNDLLQGKTLATAVAISANIIDVLGYMVPPGMTHLFLDNAWGDIGRVVGNFVYRSDVVIEHVHPVAGKAQWDDVYKEVNSGEMWDADEKAYKSWLAEEGDYAGWREKLRLLRVGA